MKTFVLFVILLLGGALFAQVAPNGGALMVNTPKGIFALRSGVLARIAPATRVRNRSHSAGCAVSITT